MTIATRIRNSFDQSFGLEHKRFGVKDIEWRAGGSCWRGNQESTSPSLHDNIGALTITYTILGVPYYNYSIMGPKTPGTSSLL